MDDRPRTAEKFASSLRRLPAQVWEVNAPWTAVLGVQGENSRDEGENIAYTRGLKAREAS